MVGPVIFIIIMIVTLVNSTTVPILTPIRITSPILGIKFCTRYYFRASGYPLILFVQTLMCLMSFTTNLTRNILFPINPIFVSMRKLTLSFTLPFCDASGNSTPCIGEQIRLMSLLTHDLKRLRFEIQVKFMTATVEELVLGQKITNSLIGLFDLSQT